MPSEQDLDIEFVTKPSFKEYALANFFCAMQQGYAAKTKKGMIEELPGSKTIEYVNGKWRVLDTYLVSPQSDHSGGMTVMWYGEIPVWMMQYVGRYDEAAIPCLKAALRANYDEGIFLGGRGPEYFKHDSGYGYHNSVIRSDFFSRTLGQEMIFGPDQKLAGVHFYQAMWMVKD